MAEPDETARPIQGGILDPLVGMGFFSGNMSLEEIKRRRAIASALASRARGFPKTIGEGLTYFGESIADAMQERRLTAAEKDYNDRYNKAAGVPGAGDTLPVVPGPAAGVSPEVLPPPAATAAVTPPPPAMARPSPLPPAPAGPMAGAVPSGDRADITRALAMRNPAMAEMIAQIGGQGVPPPGPMVTANASLAPLPTSTAGAVPAGPAPDGTTIAEEGNPATVTSAIKPMQMAQVRPPAASVQPTATPGGTLEPVIPESLPRPAAPMRSERLTPNEAYRADVLRRFPGDPRAIQEFNLAKELGSKAREAEYERQKAEHDIQMRAYEARETARQNAITNRDENRQKLAKGAADLTAAQDAEQARIYGGNLPAPVAKVLEESKEKAALSTGAIEAVNNARIAQQYAVSGFGADSKLLYYRAKAQTGDKEAQRIVQASETYKANLVPIMQQMLKSLAGKDISTKELDFIRSVSGADLSLDKESADRMLTIAEKVARQDVDSHRDTVETMIRGQREEALPALRKLYGVREPMAGVPLSDTRPPAATSGEAGGYKEGDIARGKPGQPDLVRRGGKWVPL